MSVFIFSLLAFILYMVIFHDSKMIRALSAKTILEAHKANKLKEGDSVIINNEICGTWVSFLDTEKGIAEVKINDDFIVNVFISHLSLLKSN